MHTLSGHEIDLANFTRRDVSLYDIANSLGHINRFNGHTEKPFTVLQHSVIGSYLAATPKQQMEALLHDSGEAYTGDLTYPLKQIFKEFNDFENTITGTIFNVLWPGNEVVRDGRYVKSPYMKQLDKNMAKWESLYTRPNQPFDQLTWDTREKWLNVHMDVKAELFSKRHHSDVFIERYYELEGELNG